MSVEIAATSQTVTVNLPVTELLSAAPIHSSRKRKRSRTVSGTTIVSQKNDSPKIPKKPRIKTKEQSDLDRELAAVLNGLHNLAPIGTITVDNIPRLPAPGLEAPDGWQWIEPPWDRTLVLPEPLESLRYLYNKLFLRVTYRMLSTTVARLRIYIVPKDIAGRRFFPPAPTLTKKRVKYIMSLVNTSPESWDCQLDAPWQPLVKPAKDDVPTLTDMFNQISAVPETLPDLDDPETQDLIDEVMTGSVTGMKSILYQYQRETVAEMIRKEIVQTKAIDPRLIEFVGPTGTTVYIDTDKFEVLLKPDYFDGTFGGVLSEEMGFGKTCICIALICATKFQGSRMPDQARLLAPTNKTVPSLGKTCARLINRLGLPWRIYRSSLPDKCVEMLKTTKVSYLIDDIKTSSTRTGMRFRTEVRPRSVILAGTTLIVCPESLVHQWQQELSKHVAKNYLSILTFTGNARDFRNTDLSRYDVVLMSLRKFANEFQNDTVSLLRVRFKRMIVDEGHSMGASNTNATLGAKLLHVDRKWAVTGTPVPGLIGLNVGLDSAMTNTISPPSKVRTTGSTHQSGKVAADLVKLGHIVADFLQLAPWCDNSGLWHKYCVSPFLDERRHEIVDRVLKQVMVRHRWKDLEVDVKLPPLTHEVVLLEPTVFNKININLFHAFVAVNAISSDRTDQDYLFHRANRAQLRRLVTNLQHSTFYWTGFSIDDVEFMLDVANHCLTNGKTYTAHDVELLHRCVDAGIFAMNNDAWKFSSTYHEMGYFATGMPAEASQMFDIASTVPGAGVLAGPKTLYFQHFVRKIKTREADGSVPDHAIANVAVEIAAGTTDETPSITAPVRSPAKAKAQDEAKFRNLPGVPTASASSSATHHNAAQGKGYKYFSSYTEGFLNASAVRLSSTSKFTDTVLSGSFSSKLSYLLSRISALSTDEKIIVFYEFDDVAFYLGEGLEILGLEHCFYTTSLTTQARASNLMAFNATDKFRVMLMDLNLAAHGLNITGASRIFFVNPVWQPNIEAQAMRRAHRIGQLRPVVVETLVLKGTIEQDMFDRRRHMTDQDFAVAKTLTDDEPMNKIISDSKFIAVENEPGPTGYLFKSPVKLLKHFVDEM
ncbi:P-loop containing nucleoside triphosphate hydrolase protein [Lipomyces arxii]|uniref:P-loop containing nucleoside triphosphate hydrolase protein n=1 Tax=Lipomyces arxii TaxID=56418 RepID=UPI0034CF9AD2